MAGLVNIDSRYPKVKMRRHCHRVKSMCGVVIVQFVAPWLNLCRRKRLACKLDGRLRGGYPALFVMEAYSEQLSGMDGRRIAVPDMRRSPKTQVPADF